MEQTFLTGIKILKVRHLQNMEIPLSEKERKHVILTGKNGSGKTSVLDALEKHFNYVVSDSFKLESVLESMIYYYEKGMGEGRYSESNIDNIQKNIKALNEQVLHWKDGVVSVFDYNAMREKYAAGQFILAYYRAARETCVNISNSIKKIELKNQYSVEEEPGRDFVLYMANMKATSGMAFQAGIKERTEEIETWFERFEKILKKVFEDENLELHFDIENYTFTIHQSGHEPFDFNQTSSGYSAVFNIILDLMMRSEKRGRDIEGIVLIDEIETHLHLELQRIILPILTELFPKIQFVVSSHSPFILSSLENAVIFDLEKGTLVENGLGGYPYEGIVEGYFNADRLSIDLADKFREYKEIAAKKDLTDADCARIMELQVALDEIPDYLSPDIAAEYSRIKLELENRG